MSDKAYLDPSQDSFAGHDDDHRGETEDLSSVESKNRTQTVNWNTTLEHRGSASCSKNLGPKRKHETTDHDAMKKQTVFSDAKQQQDTRFNIGKSLSSKPGYVIPSSLPVSVIRHTRDEPLHTSCPPENTNAIPELTNAGKDNVPTNSSFDVCDVPGPSHFVCDVCNKCFFFKSGLDRHYTIHSGEKSFTCQFCEQKFSVKGNLTRHLLTHSEQKVHECDRCHKVYSRKDNLERHYRIHTGEKPYTCEKCGKSFSDPSISNKHRKRCKSSSKDG